MFQPDKKFDVLVAGELNPDLILSDPCLTPEFGQHEILVENAELTIGSSSAIFACGAARLGLKVAFIGVVGTDEFGSFMLKSLQKRDVDVSHVIVDPGIKTGLSVILNRKNDRAIMTYSGAISSLRAEQVSPGLLGECRHLHVASYFLQDSLRPGLLGLFQKAKEMGLTTSLDTNWDPAERWEGLDGVLPITDVFLPNEAELLSLTKEKSIEEAVMALNREVSIVAVKLGASGAVAATGRQFIKAPPIKMEKIADTVGAGDSFDAGFIYGYLHGWDLKKILSLATACGSLSLRKHGGTESQPSLSEALQLIEESAPSIYGKRMVLHETKKSTS